MVTLSLVHIHILTMYILCIVHMYVHISHTHTLTGRTKYDISKYVRHCCPTCKKIEVQSSSVIDEMLRVTGREVQIINKVKHVGIDEFGPPYCSVWDLEQCDDFSKPNGMQSRS